MCRCCENGTYKKAGCPSNKYCTKCFHHRDNHRGYEKDILDIIIP